MTTKEALELMANVCKLGDIIDRQKIDLQSATLRAERAGADLAAARAPVYAEADIVVDSGEAPASEAVKKIREALGFA